VIIILIFNHHANHNTALELSNLIIISTRNSQILAQIIILYQSKEIFELYFLEKSLNNHWMKSITNNLSN